MNLEQFRDYCLSKKHATEDFPFDDVTLCFKVAGKIFAITGLNNPKFKVNLKCDPEKSIQLREEWEEVQPGYHMNKKNWNTIDFQGRLPSQALIELIDHSYDLVYKSLTKKIKEELNTNC